MKPVMKLLAADGAEGFALGNLRIVLGDAACWPAVAEYSAKALRIRPEGPNSAAIGSCLLVSISQDGARTALWRIVTDARFEYDFLQDAKRCVDTALTRAAEDLPCLIDPGLAPIAPRWGASFLWQNGEGVDSALGDLSYGLSMALAAGSHMTMLPLPQSIAASARLDAHGALGEVGGLPEKLLTIAGSALGVSVVYIAEEQRETDAELLRGLPRVIELRRRARLKDVLGEVFADAEERLRRRWADPTVARHDAQKLFLLTLRSSGTQNWTGVARTAGWLAAVVEDAAAKDQARFAWQVAQRHAGKGEPVAWPEDSFFEDFGRTDRMQFIAHVVQAARDAGADDRRALIERATKALAVPYDRTDGDWIVLGALGRAWASLGEDREARACLKLATTGWSRERGKFGQASRPICEWIRLAGVAGDRDDLAEAKQLATMLLEDPGTTEDSRTFVWFEMGRAAVLTKEHRLALELLRCSANSPVVARHVRWSSLRWTACAYAALGDVAAAERCRKMLAEEAGDCVEVRLAWLDAALESGVDVGAALEAVRESDPEIVEALLAICPEASSEGRAAYVARHYPY